MKRLIKIRISFTIAFILTVFNLSSFSTMKARGQIPWPDLSEKLNGYFIRYPQQKAYLHLDKLAYHAGERIWYKAYLVDARTHKPDTISRNLVVELINSFGKTSMIQMLKIENGFARGDFLLTDTIPQGLYRIRAYTNWMRNFGKNYFFSREINIWNPEHSANLYRDDRLANKRFKKKSRRKAEKLDVQFFPEGGNLVQGLTSRVGFKGTNELGLGVDVDGEIQDSKGKTVVTFESMHLGMGYFDLKPEPGNDYRALVNKKNGKTERFDLPEVLDRGYVMSVVHREGSGIRVHIQSTYRDESVFLACHIRGTLVHTGEYRTVNGEAEIDIPYDGNRGGIMHVTLFDSGRIPRCERLTFVTSENILSIVAEPVKNEYETREQVKLSITVKDQEGKPVQGNFSLAVSDRDLVNYAGNFQAGIIPSLLLVSDLSGRVENPGFYFENHDAFTRQALDALLMTQGWRRFIWEDVINEERLQIDYPIQKGLTVHGRVTKNFFDIPLKNLPVTLTVLSEFNDVFRERTDDRGRFAFDLPDYEDTLSVRITAERESGRKNLVIYIDDNDLPQKEKYYSSYSKDMAIEGTNVLKPAPREVEDTLQPRTEGIYQEADFVLEVEDYMRNYSSVLEMIQGRIPGVMVSGNSVVIRGESSFLGSSEPLFLLDNVPVNLSTIQSINPQDVERIEVLKGPSASIYGVRGANGVIAVFTRRGEFQIKGRLDFEMLGYHRPREFYSPKYGTGFDHLIEDYRSCLYWDPEIQTDSEGKANISFFNSEKAGKYFIVLEGISKNGKIGSFEKSYTVVE